jgi:hypothetical protein
MNSKLLMTGTAWAIKASNVEPSAGAGISMTKGRFASPVSNKINRAEEPLELLRVGQWTPAITVICPFASNLRTALPVDTYRSPAASNTQPLNVGTWAGVIGTEPILVTVVIRPLLSIRRKASGAVSSI